MTESSDYIIIVRSPSRVRDTIHVTANTAPRFARGTQTD
jgi:hypothetical protein